MAQSLAGGQRLRYTAAMPSDLIEILPAMAVFVAVGKAKNFGAAARALGMPLSTVSRRVTELEKRVRLQLLTRTSRKVELTSSGAAYFQRCCEILEAAEAAQAELAGYLEHPRGHLRVSASADFAHAFLTGLFADFARRYPEVSFEFDLSPRLVDLVAESFDVAVRIGKLADSQLHSRKLGDIHFALYASPDYLAKAGPLTNPRQLAKHECLHLLRPSSAQVVWALRQGGKEIRIPVASPRFVANNYRFLTQLTAMGFGVATLAMAVASADVQAGRLERVLPEWQRPPEPVHALTPSKLTPAKTKLFLDCLAEHVDFLTADK